MLQSSATPQGSASKDDAHLVLRTIGTAAEPLDTDDRACRDDDLHEHYECGHEGDPEGRAGYSGPHPLPRVATNSLRG